MLLGKSSCQVACAVAIAERAERYYTGRGALDTQCAARKFAILSLEQAERVGGFTVPQSLLYGGELAGFAT